MFAGVIGHSQPQLLLSRALARGQLHHAWLFTGPPGVGRHRVAIGLAQAANCERNDGTACGMCSACRRIGMTPSLHPDVWSVELEDRDPKDPAKGKRDVLTVEQIRELQRGIGYRLAEGRCRVVIVDPADQLHESAANAFLKVLEEPPPSTVLVLVARSLRTVLPTIQSRCQKLRFGVLSEQEISQSLVERGIPPEAAALRARLCGGSLGKALLLDDAALSDRRALLEAWRTARGGDDRARMAFADEFEKDSERFLMFLSLVTSLLRDVIASQIPGGEAGNPDCLDFVDDLRAEHPGEGPFLLLDRIQRIRTRLVYNANLRGLAEEMAFLP